ncbi:Protein WVD2-like 2, partial [Cucurbita argyrosperma subsp. argyrosperma]
KGKGREEQVGEPGKSCQIGRGAGFSRVMGREIDGVMEKPNGSVVVLNGVSHDKVLVSPKVIDSEELGSEENSVVESYQEKENNGVGIRSSNLDASVSSSVFAPAPVLVSVEKKAERTVAQKISDFNKSISPRAIAVSPRIVRVNHKAQQPTVQAREKAAMSSPTIETKPSPKTVVEASSTTVVGASTTTVVGASTTTVVEASPKTVVEASPKTPNSPQSSRRSSHNDLKKYHEEEDHWSIASSTIASVQQLKSKVTIGTAPTFRSAKRADKRKEYYNKLEEKQKAMEAERIQYEARIKEEQEAAIKQLRKGLVIKAKPVPNFYYEGPPPKVELKKEKGKVCARAHRHGFGIQRSESANSIARKSKAQANGQCQHSESFKHRNHAKHDNETSKMSSATTDPHETNEPMVTYGAQRCGNGDY